jgi:uncharacterized protein YfdQ (DUF2303 family)
MSDQDTKTTISLDALGIGELAQRAALSPRVENITSPDGVTVQVMLIPYVESNGRMSVRLEGVDKFVGEYRTRPMRRTGTANLGDLESLIAHVNRFKDADSVVFANPDRDNPSITAVLDYHRAGATADPRFGGHRSHYAFPVSDEWKAWMEVNGEEMSQGKLAEFIEAHMIDVVKFDPKFASAATFAEKCGVTFGDPAQILELSRGLAVYVDSKLATKINLQNGVTQFQFTEDHQGADGQPLKVPGAFLIGIPVFRAGDRFPVCVRLRYRKQGPMLVWIMELWRHEEVFDIAIKDACEKVKTATSLPLMVGRPE